MKERTELPQLELLIRWGGGSRSKNKEGEVDIKGGVRCLDNRLRFGSKDCRD